MSSHVPRPGGGPVSDTVHACRACLRLEKVEVKKILNSCVMLPNRQTRSMPSQNTFQGLFQDLFALYCLTPHKKRNDFFEKTTTKNVMGFPNKLRKTTNMLK